MDGGIRVILKVGLYITYKELISRLGRSKLIWFMESGLTDKELNINNRIKNKIIVGKL